jgi:hypothetical protein
MMQRLSPKWMAVGLLVIMAVLMIGASWQDSATVDETTHLSAGYSYWHGYRYLMAANHPALSQMLEAAPLLFMDIKRSDIAEGILKGQLGYPWMLPWTGTPTSVQPLLPLGCQGQYVKIPPLDDVMVRWNCPDNYPLDNWYYWAVPECQIFGKTLVYGGLNDGDAMLFAGRLVQVALTLLTGVIIFIWTRRAANNDWVAVTALALWVFNPIALAYGHLTNTDISVTFGMALAVYLWGRFLEQPTYKAAALCGAAIGMALAMKFTAIILAPVFVIALLVSWKRLNVTVISMVKMIGLLMLAGWVVIMIVYVPRWAPARPPTTTEIAVLGIPGWFQTFRPFLIPADFFKVIAMALSMSKSGYDAYLVGAWSHEGWWYYFPSALFFKSPVSYMILMIAGIAVFVRHVRTTRPLEYMAWLGAGVYLLSAMTSHFNLGVRHLLPILPLLPVGMACALQRLKKKKARMAVNILLGWQALVVIAAYPLYIQFFSEAVGGAPNGYHYLIDSNYDWGQDAKRLKKFLDEKGIQHIYLDYFGTQYSIEYLKIPNTRVSAESAKQIQQGTLVVSVSQLMRPEWAWLRESRQPTARVADTLFIYNMGS